VAVNAFNQTKATERGTLRAADESRLSTAVNNLDSELPAQRLAGVALLRRLAAQKVESANEGDVKDSDRRDALRLFRATLNILENYVNHPTPSSPAEPKPPPPSGPPVDNPQMSLDSLRAANEISDLLKEKTEYLKLRSRFPHESPFPVVRDADASHEDTGAALPAIDLSRTTLYGVYWKGIDFSWLGGRQFVQADLREASLDDSNFSASKEQKGANLTDAFVQCAHLNGAKLQGATLRFAHLERADLTGVHLEGADLTGAHLEGAILTGAHLEGADLEGAHVAGATVQGLSASVVGMSPAMFNQFRNFGDAVSGVQRQAVPDDVEQLGCDGRPATT
jgi:hypothetical protein